MYIEPVPVSVVFISIVWRADSWRRWHAAPQLAALQTMEMPLDGDTQYERLLNLQTLACSSVSTLFNISKI